ncbi:hypothetical protein ACFSTC_32705 [Nonomuraea ferruginea]
MLVQRVTPAHPLAAARGERGGNQRDVVGRRRGEQPDQLSQLGRGGQRQGVAQEQVGGRA